MDHAPGPVASDLLLGTWVGLKLFGHLNEASFRKVVLLLLLASGVTLVI